VGIVSVAVNPHNPAIVFTSGSASGGHGIYRSTDCGATWTKANTGRNAEAIDSGYQWQIVIDPMDTNVMFATNGYGGPATLFKSTDAGSNWDPVFAPGSEVANTVPGGFTQNVSMDPNDSRHLVVTFHVNCTGTFGPMCMAETTDGGASWRLFKGPTNGWQEAAGPLVIDATSFLYASPFDGLFFTGDGGAHWEKVSAGAFADMYRSPTTHTYYLGSNSGVLKSKDGRAWLLIPNSPRAVGVIGDGQSVFVTFQNDSSGRPFYSALEANITRWTNLSTPNIHQGGSMMQFDSEHSILYSSDYNAGLWRLMVRRP
jgi:Sortilin, neurotensin receptor 3,